LTKLSSGDKHTFIEDASIERLLDLAGQIMDMGGGFWVKIEAQRVPASAGKPAGIDYSLCLFSPENERLLGYDNAHPIRVGTGPGARRTVVHDHVHKAEAIKSYAYASAEALLIDFWTGVERILKQRGVP